MSNPSNPAYATPPGRPADLADRLRAFRSSGHHVSWPDDASLCDAGLFALSVGHRQLTDVYRLGLARAHDGRLATFDRSIPVRAVRGARPEHVVVIAAWTAGSRAGPRIEGADPRASGLPAGPSSRILAA